MKLIHACRLAVEIEKWAVENPDPIDGERCFVKAIELTSNAEDYDVLVTAGIDVEEDGETFRDYQEVRFTSFAEFRQWAATDAD